MSYLFVTKLRSLSFLLNKFKINMTLYVDKLFLVKEITIHSKKKNLFVGNLKSKQSQNITF